VNLADIFQAPDYSGQFNTQLTPVAQSLFAQQMAQRMRDMRDYDLQGAWAQQGGGQLPPGHMPDTFKKPNHPTFSTGSIYAGGDNSAGVWSQLPNGQWTFMPGPANATFGLSNLQQYFDQREPGNLLLGMQ